MDLFDLIGSVLSLICTYLFVRADQRAWVMSAIAIPFDAFVYFRSQLFGDMFLQCFYLASTAYGWYQWRFGGQQKHALKISFSSFGQIATLVIGALIAIEFIYPLLKPFNEAGIARLDAVTTVVSLCAQWLLCKKKIETWILWLIVDALYMYLYGVKSLPFHSIMAMIYLLMACAGFYHWFREYTEIKATSVSALNN